MNEEKRYMQIAKEMNLCFNSQSAGVIYWKPEGFKLYENLKNFVRKHHEKRGNKTRPQKGLFLSLKYKRWV